MKPPPVDIICGGFPCQDISNAGKRVGIDGERSGLWSEFARIIRVLRPRVVFVENVAALLVRGVDRVLGDLAALGFDAEWEVFRASDVGAPHLRARLFILAYRGDGLRELADLAYTNVEARRRAPRLPVGGDRETALRSWAQEPGRRGSDLANAPGPRRDDAEDAGATRGGAGASEAEEGRRQAGLREPQRVGGLADATSERRPEGRPEPARQRRDADASCDGDPNDVADANGRRGNRLYERNEPGHMAPLARERGEGSEAGQVADANGGRLEGERRSGCGDDREDARGSVTDGRGGFRWGHRFPPGPSGLSGWDGPQPAIRRGDDGVPGRIHRLRLLGNAVVWQQAALALQTLAARAGAREAA